MVEIQWLTKAINDLKDIYHYISRDSKRYAKRQVDQIIDKTRTLKNHIRAGRLVQEINKPEIREIIEGNYRIIYRIVLHPWHTRNSVTMKISIFMTLHESLKSTPPYAHFLLAESHYGLI